jgi:hypothetical protein
MRYKEIIPSVCGNRELIIYFFVFRTNPLGAEIVARKIHVLLPCSGMASTILKWILDDS